MKRILIIILVFNLFTSCRKDQTDLTYKECYSEITNASRAYFYEDAVEFGMQRLASDSLTDYVKNLVCREEPVVYVLGKLCAIYNEATALESPLHDMIFKYGIHKSTRYNRKWIGMRFNDYEIQLEFAKNPRNIGNLLLDELILRRGFKLHEPSKWSTKIHV